MREVAAEDETLHMPVVLDRSSPPEFDASVLSEGATAVKTEDRGERAPTRILPVVEPTVPSGHIPGFEVLGPLGEGGMAQVFRGRQPSLDRPVAIKSLRREFWGDEELVRRFEREAIALARLQGEHVVQVLDLLATEDGGRHIAMELLEGEDAFDRIDRLGPLPPAAVASIGLGVACALERAHRRGIVHRDIKPSNVFLTHQGEVKLMDFGIARDPGRGELTQIGLSLGTPAYMAPEQIRGEAVDGRADQFALGVVLYELLVGEPPWPEKQSTNVALEVLRTPAPPLLARCPDAPPALVHVIERCLQKEPTDRWASTSELRAALERLAPPDRRGALLGSEKQRPKPQAPSSLRPVVLAHALGLVAILLATCLGLYVSS